MSFVPENHAGGNAERIESARVLIAPHDNARTTPPAALETALQLHAAGLWPVPLYPPGVLIGDKRTTGKEPIGKAWGAARNTPAKLAATYRKYPGAGVGIALGPGRGPGGSWLIDIEGDGPEAEDSRTKLLGGECVDTRGWGSVRGGHGLFIMDDARMAAMLPRMAGLEGKGPASGAYHLPGYPDLELRLGGVKPDGTVKQLQSACPPTPGTNGKPREWNGVETIAPAPEAFYSALAEALTPPPPAPAGNGRGGDGPPARKPTDPAAAWFRAALEREAAKVASAPAGQRHDALRDATNNLAGQIPLGYLTEAEVRDAMTAAASWEGPPDQNALDTIRAGLEYGQANPLPWPNGLARRGGDGQAGDNGHAEANGRHATNGDGRRITFAPEVDGADEDPINLTDWGNARRLVKRFGKDVRYCPKWGAWLIWDGRRWREDETGEIYRLTKKTVRGLGAEASNLRDPDEVKALYRWAIASESKKRIDATVGLAWSEPGVPVVTGQLDSDPWVLNVENGTIDLKTGELRPHRQDDLITKLAPVAYDPNAECPRWCAFLDKVMGGNRDLVNFLRRAAGYALTGDVSEHALLFFYGSGRNGKGTFLETFLAILGDYAASVDSSLLTSKNRDDHPTGLTDLDGRRFVTTQEVQNGRRMAEALVKRLTGGDRIKARRMRENFYEFEPTHKLFFAANHKPEIRGTDEGIWSRIMLVPFEVFIPPAERDRNLKNILVREEGPGILAWAVRGCLEWQETGLNPPSVVSDATKSYRVDQDVLGAFFAEHCELGSDLKIRSTPLYASYKAWAERSGEPVLPHRKFGAAMTERGFPRYQNDGIWYRGIDLRDGING